MSKKESEKGYRALLNRTFWGAAAKAGCKDYVEDILVKHAGKTSVSDLTTDELYKVTKYIIDRHNLDYHLPQRAAKKTKARRQPPAFIPSQVEKMPDRRELATLEQTQKLYALQQASGYSNRVMWGLMEKNNLACGFWAFEPLRMVVAQRMIEALKAMIKRGWKETGQEDQPPAPAPQPKPKAQRKSEPVHPDPMDALLAQDLRKMKGPGTLN